jgi:hypothetical protein
LELHYGVNTSVKSPPLPCGCVAGEAWAYLASFLNDPDIPWTLVPSVLVLSSGTDDKVLVLYVLER